MKTKKTTESTVLIGYVGVDSGQLMVCDPCYIKGDDWKDTDYEPTTANASGHYPLNYNGACGATLSDKGYGTLAFDLGHGGAGVAFSSGWGDGEYPVYATIIDGRVARVEIVMIDEDDSDYEDEDEDDE